MSRTSTFLVFVLAVLAFLTPLKFVAPVTTHVPLPPPSDAFEWLFFSWPNEILILVAFAVLLLPSLALRERCVRSDWLSISLLLFLLSQILPWFSSINRAMSADTILHFAACLIVFCTAARCVRDGATAATVFAGLGLATLMACVLGLQQYFGGLEETRQLVAQYGDPSLMPAELRQRLTSNRVFGPMALANTLAGFLTVAFAPTLAWIWARARGWDMRVRWLAMGFAGAMMLATLMMTGSRGGFAAFAAAAVVGLWVSLRRHRRRVALVLLVVVALAGVFATAMRGGLTHLGTSSLGARLDYWRGAAGIIKDHPWTGTGPGTFGSIYTKYKTATTEEAQTAHNSYLQMWSDSGVLAFIAFAALWMIALHDAFRLARDRAGDAAAAAVCAGLTGWVVHGLVDFDLYVPGVAIPAFLLLGILQGLKEAPAPETSRGPWRWLAGAVCAVVALTVMWRESRALAAVFAQPRQAAVWMPGDARYQAAAGLAAAQAGQWEEAIEHHQAAVRTDPQRASHHGRLARALMAAGRTREAVAELRQAVALNPTHPGYRAELAQAEEKGAPESRQ